MPSSDAAVVNGEHITQADLDRRLSEAKCSYQLQKRTFPKAGSQEYQAIQQQVLQNFVQRIELKQKAPSLGVSVSDKQVEDQLTSLKKQYFGGSEKKYAAELKKQCVTDKEVRDDIRANLLSNAIFNKVTAGAVVTAAQVKSYFDAHREVYTSPQTRVVSHILVKDKALADRLYGELKGGASFAALAKKYSTDPSSKDSGGKMTISKGRQVPEFDKVAFALKTHEVGKPVKSTYGWHVIEALTPITKQTTTKLSEVRAAIRQQLLQQKKQDEMRKWVDDTQKDFKSKTSFQVGYEPPATTNAATTPPSK